MSKRRDNRPRSLRMTLPLDDPGIGYLHVDSDPQSVDLAESLVDEASAALPGCPENSRRSAREALRVLESLPSTTLARNSLVIPSVRANALRSLGSACRLLGDLDESECAFNSAATLVASSADTARLLRDFALLRWDQGRCHEAIGLLIRAEHLFRLDDCISEVAATNRLLILLHAEMGEAAEVISRFTRLDPGDDSSNRTWLIARSAFTAAFSFADESRPSEALAALDQGTALIVQLADSEELFHLRWLEARARARLGYIEEAEPRLSELRAALCLDNDRHYLEYHLLTLDLLALRVAVGRQTQDLLDDFERFSSRTNLSADILRFWLELGQGSSPWKITHSLGFELQRAFRVHYLSAPRLPFG